MKIHNLYFKLAALFLCLTLVVSVLNPATAYAQEAEYLRLQKKIQKQYEQGIPADEILMNLNDSEKEILLATYSDVSYSEYISVFSVELEDNPEVAVIDALAAEYYSFYEQYGYFPDTEENEYVNQALNIDPSLTGRNIESFNISSIAPMSEYDQSAIMKVIGYTYSIAEIAAHLAKIGALIINAALPFLILIAILAGTVILTFAIGGPFALSTSVIDTVGVWYYNSKYEVAKSKQETALAIAQEQSGVKYWLARLQNYFGYGGISLERAIDRDEARSIIRNNTDIANVLTATKSLAIELALSIGQGSYKGPEVHRSNNKYLNWQHIHARPNQNSILEGFTHIFYLVPLDYPL